MREIKFRTWVVKDERWLDNSTSLTLLNKIATGYVKNSEDFIFTQYTGLKDCTKRNIYEGDTMEGEDAFGVKIKGTVCFREGAFLLITDNLFFTFVGHSNHSHTYFKDMASQLKITGFVVGNLTAIED